MFEVPRSEWDDGKPIGPRTAEALEKLDRTIPELKAFAVSGDQRADAVRFFEITDSPHLENIERGADPVEQLESRRDQIHQMGGVEDHHTASIRRIVIELEPLELEVIERILSQTH